MARLYTNENFPQQAVDVLRQLGHDVLTTHDAGKSNTGVPDDAVVAFATEQNRVVVTLNRWDFIRLHKQSQAHAGILVCTQDRDYDGLAHRIDHGLRNATQIRGALIRISRNSPVSRWAKSAGIPALRGP